MLANNALKIIFSHPAATAGLGGLIGGSGALVYNAFSKPTLDEYGNPIESNDINPFIAAGIGSGVGLVGGMGARMMTPQWSNKFGNVYSQAVRQTPQEVQGYDGFRNAAISIRGNKQVRNQNPQIPEELMPVFEPRSQEELEASIEWIRKNREAYQQYQSQKPNPTAMPNPQLPSGFQELTPQQRVLAAKAQINSDGYRLDANRYYFNNGENKYNVAGWDLIDPSPEGNAWNRELNSDAIKYQKWLESEAIIRGRNQNPQVIGNDLFDADGNMIFDYPEKKIV